MTSRLRPEAPAVLRGLAAPDVAAVMRLERELFGAEAWTESLLREELATDTRYYIVAVVDDEVVGYGGLCAYPYEAFIQTLAVAPAQQSRGIGRALLRELIDECDRRGPLSLLLEVRADNEAAQALYAAHGFEPVGLRRGYYQPSGVDAVVMRRRQGAP